MLSSSVIFLVLTSLLGAGSVGGLLLAALYPRVRSGAALDRQLELISATGTLASPRGGTTDDSRRKRAVEVTLREAEEKLKFKAEKRFKPSLLVRMRQGKISWSRKTYYLVCVATGIVVFFLILITAGLGALAAVGFGISGGLLLPHWYVNIKRNRRFKRFSAEFPNAVDVIVRGIKSGLPLGDCLKIIAAETQEPVKGEFKTLIEDHTLGMPWDEAVQRLPDRMPLSEASFFAIVIAIQSRTGGSLSEALGNLSKVLRERKKMEGKIKAMSGEAKASAGIIGALPVVVAGLLFLTSPDYVALDFTTLTGRLIMVACGVLMLSGTLMMRKMINFDF
jgi:tight adherence protein B